MTDLQNELRLQLTNAQDRYKFYADRRRKTPPAFKVGDRVWLLARNINTTQPSKKLDYKRLGPYLVVEQVAPLAFRLALPPGQRLHDVFHVSLLETHHASSIPGRVVPPPPAIVINGSEEYEVDEVLDSRYICRDLQYLVSWKGFNIGERSWERSANLANCQVLINAFHNANPEKPGPEGGVI